MKILSPVGNFESLKMAIFNGADEVYLGINDFNARNNIDGFRLDNLQEAVDLAHIFGVKVNLAINILFSNGEMQKALDVVVDAYNIGVDCFIVQDLGLASLIHKYFPEIEIHASTQMGIHNLEGVQAIEKFGFKRVVLARETPIDEIKRIKDNSSVEIEYFAQGALCVAFSGNCYLSSYLCNASGNRGKCKQLCRLPYSLEKDGKVIKKGFLLSAKDFNMIKRLDDLKNAGVDVIKIEGRARRPAYVGIATREYYNAINENKYNINNLKLAFNREYTEGYLNGNGDIISQYNNHIGLKVGLVTKFVKGKNFNEIYFSSNRKVYPKSTFKIYNNEKEKNTITAYDLKEIDKDKYKLTTTQKVSVGDSVHLILDEKLENEMLSTKKKNEIIIDIIAKADEPIKANVAINNKNIELLGEVLQPSLNQPLTIEDLKNNFSKSELFDVDLRVVKLEKVFIQKQKLNEFRRSVFAKIQEELLTTGRKNLKKIKLVTQYNVLKFKDFQIIENLNEDFKAKNIIYSPEVYDVKMIKQFQEKCKSLNKIAILDTPNFALRQDVELLKEIVNETKIAIVANNYYALGFDTKIVIGAGLNVYNSYTAEVYDKEIITAESDLAERIDFPYMTLRHCPMKSHLKANCANCPYSEGYIYRMENGKTLKLKRKKMSSCTFYLV